MRTPDQVQARREELYPALAAYAHAGGQTNQEPEAIENMFLARYQITPGTVRSAILAHVRDLVVIDSDSALGRRNAIERRVADWLDT